MNDRMALHPEEIEADVLCLSKLLSDLATKYRSMWAFGTHLRVQSVEDHLKTCDSGVAATFRRPWRSGVRDRNHVVADVEYVGCLHEIVELNYGGLCVIVLLCGWLKAISEGNNATMKKDKWGFMLANFQRLVPFGPEAFAFPMHVDQVFFADAKEEPGWKVILRNELIRGQRVVGNFGAVQVAGMFGMDDDADHEGLRTPKVILEENDAPLPTRRTVRREDAIVERLDEIPEVDLQVGESGSSSEED